VAVDESFESFRATVVVDRPLPLLDVLACFDVIRRPVVGAEAVARIAREALEDAATDRVELCELRYSPLTLARAAGLTMDQTRQAVCRGIAAAQEAGVAVDAPLCVVISRRHGIEAAWEVLRHVEQDQGDTYVGIDFASDELRHSSGEFSEIAQAFFDMSLPITVHTGEGVGPDRVREAVELPGVRRLGHALSLVDDLGLAEEVRSREMTVEVSPTSNVRTGLVASYGEHPARILRERGLHLVLCSDDPELFAVSLSHELKIAREQMGWTDADIEQSQAWARQACFGSRSAR
jgi:adenosine deaminase